MEVPSQPLEALDVRLAKLVPIHICLVLAVHLAPVANTVKMSPLHALIVTKVSIMELLVVENAQPVLQVNTVKSLPPPLVLLVLLDLSNLFKPRHLASNVLLANTVIVAVVVASSVSVESMPWLVLQVAVLVKAGLTAILDHLGVLYASVDNTLCLRVVVALIVRLGHTLRMRV
jgi:hypothetical protein